MDDMDDLEGAWGGYKLVTAEISYQLPDNPAILFHMWQEFDKPTLYPRLNEFLRAWLKETDGKLRSVKVGVGGPLMPGSARTASTLFSIN